VSRLQDNGYRAIHRARNVNRSSPQRICLHAHRLPAYDARSAIGFAGSTRMPHDRDVQVHLLPDLAPPGRLSRGLAVVIDVLRSTTTMIHALASGCIAVRPCLEVEEARQLAGQMRAGRVLLGGERGGLACPGFDLGNSPTEYTAKACCGTTVVLTTTNGTRACHRAAEAERVLIAGFVNYSAVCEQLRQDG